MADGEYYELDGIVGWMVHGGNSYYLVKWTNYGYSQIT